MTLLVLLDSHPQEAAAAVKVPRLDAGPDDYTIADHPRWEAQQRKEAKEKALLARQTAEALAAEELKAIQDDLALAVRRRDEVLILLLEDELRRKIAALWVALE